MSVAFTEHYRSHGLGAPLDLYAAWVKAIEERDRARSVAVALEQENARLLDRQCCDHTPECVELSEAADALVDRLGD